MHPKVDISVGSRFHAFDLARELAANHSLGTLHTGYPGFAGHRFGVPTSHIQSVWTHEPLNRMLGALYRRGYVDTPYDARLSARFDAIVAARLRPASNVFVGWSSQCLASLQRAKALGMVTVVERGSTHVHWQADILKAEASTTGLPTEVPDPQTIDREIAEYEMADKIAVPSRFVARTFVHHGVNPEKLMVNPYGVDLTRFCPKTELPEIASGGALKALHVGRVSVRKGIHYLLEAVAAVPECELTIVGGMDDRLLPLLRRSRARLLGPLSGSLLPDVYRSAEVFCLLSIEEGLALVCAQAMASGLPVIATPNTGADELITDGIEGFIVPACDPHAVADRLRLLAHDPQLRRQMGSAARQRVTSGFSWTDYGRRAVSAYSALLGGPIVADG